jgi:transposase-like protein
MAKRTYTPEQKAEALRLYEKHGAGEAARRMQMPVQTVSSWARRAGIQTDAPAAMTAAIEMAQLSREQKREELKNRLLDKALDMLGRMDEPHIDYKGKDVVKVHWEKAPSGACQNYANAAGTLIDKFRLEMGEAPPGSASDDEFRGLLIGMNAQRQRSEEAAQPIS